MKKNTLIAVGVLVALVVVLFVLLRSPTKEPAAISFSVPAMENADKVEIKEGDSTIAFAKKDGAWRLSKPVDAPLAKPPAEALDKLLAKGFGMDRTLKDVEDKTKYELTDTSPTVTVYAGGDKKVSFKVGKEQVVKETYVKRTYILPEGQEVIYRAQAGLKTDLIKKLDDWREKRITEFEETAMVGYELAYADKKLVFARGEGGEWSMSAPAGIETDANAIKRIATSAGRIRVAGFADGKTLAETGLDKPIATLTFKVKDKAPVVLLLGGEVPADPKAAADTKPEVERYIKLKGADYIYTLKSYGFATFNKTLGDFRNKDMLSLELPEVTKVVFPPPVGQEKPLVVVRAEGDTWKLESPEPKTLEKSAVEGILRVLTKLRAQNIPDGVSAADAGLAGEGLTPKKIEITLSTGATATVWLGNKTSTEDLYARVGDAGLIFTVGAFNAGKLNPTIGDLMKKAEPPKMPQGGIPGMPGGIPGMPGGMPGGLPPGMMPNR